MGDNDAVSFSFHTLDTGDPETLVPTDVARSLWSSNQMHGVAISGSLARAVERANHRDDLRPARYTVDMFKPATMDPFRVETEVVREGSRICLVDARLVQGGETRARASTVWLRPSEYSPEPTPITRALIEDGRRHLMFGSEIRTGCPVHILQGMQDPDVPWRHALKLVEHLAGDAVVLTLIKDGDHRLSTAQDILRLQAAVAGIATAP